VQPTALENKRLFLLKKGLTESEIKEAFNLAGCNNDSTTTTTVQSNTTSSDSINKEQLVSPVVPFKPVKRNIWWTIFKWIKNFLMAGCLAYTAYKLFIKKYLFPESKKISTLNRIQMENKNLSDSIREMKASLNSLKSTLEEMNNLLKATSQNDKTAINSDDSYSSSTSLKNELQTIKSLLLNRTQFPALPNVAPILPSWQLENAKTSKENSPDLNDKTKSLFSIEKSDTKLTSDEVENSDEKNDENNN